MRTFVACGHFHRCASVWNYLCYDEIMCTLFKISGASHWSMRVMVILEGVSTNKKYVIDSVLPHWGRVTHICVSDLTSIGSDNGLSPGRRQAIIRTNAGILLIRPLGTNFSEFLVEILIFSFKKMRLEVLSGKRRPFCLGLNEPSSKNSSPQSWKYLDLRSKERHPTDIRPLSTFQKYIRWSFHRQWFNSDKAGG